MSTGASNRVFAYEGPNGTLINQLGLQGKSGIFKYDTSNPARLGVLLADNSTATISSTGLNIYAANCSEMWSLQFDNHTSQDPCKNGSGAQSRRTYSDHQRREVEQSFEFDFQLVDECGNEDENSQAFVSIGQTACGYKKDAGSYVATCTFPGASSPEALCEAHVTKDLDFITNGNFGQVTNWENTLKALSKTGVGAGLLSKLIKYLGAGALGEALMYLGAVQVVVTALGSDKIAAASCQTIYYGIPEDLIVVADGNRYTVTSITAAPTTIVQATLTVPQPHPCKPSSPGGASSSNPPTPPSGSSGSGVCKAVSGQPVSDPCLDAGVWVLDDAAVTDLVSQSLLEKDPSATINSLSITGTGSLGIMGNTASFQYEDFVISLDITADGLEIPTVTTINGEFTAKLYLQSSDTFCLDVTSGSGSAVETDPLSGGFTMDLAPDGGFIEQQYVFQYTCSPGRLVMGGFYNGVQVVGPYVYKS
jgi:hypothetical protein